MRAKAQPVAPITRGGRMLLWTLALALALLVAGAAWKTTSGLYWERTSSGLQYRVIREGQGPRAQRDDVASITYTGRLLDGTVFDSNEGGPPTEMSVGGVVPGFSEALQLMNKGATYQIRIPPELGYGDRVQPGGPIPPNATLDFVVTLVDRRPPSADEVQQMRAMEEMQRQQLEALQRQSQQGAAPGGETGEGASEPRRPRGR